jgi:hypothetical protein
MSCFAKRWRASRKQSRAKGGRGGSRTLGRSVGDPRGLPLKEATPERRQNSHQSANRATDPVSSLSRSSARRVVVHDVFSGWPKSPDPRCLGSSARSAGCLDCSRSRHAQLTPSPLEEENVHRTSETNRESSRANAGRSQAASAKVMSFSPTA